MAEHNDLGRRGEELAVDHLKSSGYQILERNYRHGRIEVDIIAQIDSTLAVIEVKTRSSDVFGSPKEFIKSNQISNLTLAINDYVIKNELEVEVRFDIISIVYSKNESKLEHLKDAFYHF